MLKTTYTPQKTCIELPISNEYIGQKVEVVYEIYRVPKESKKEDCQSSNDISDIFDKHLYSFGNFKFNRNEANDYE